MIKKKFSSRLYTLRKIHWTISQMDALTLYKSSILPLFDQGSQFYSCASQKSLHFLRTLQNKALRIVYKRRKWPGTDLAHSNSKLKTLKNRSRFFLLRHAHERSYNPSNMRIAPQRSLRLNNSLLLKVSLAKNQKFEKSSIFQSMRPWNNLDEDIKGIHNFNGFKTCVKYNI